MELPGKRRSGRPKRRFKDAVREDMQESQRKTENRTRWENI